MSELKERFLTVYKETVTRAGSDSLLDWLEHSDFFVALASTKYLGCYESGLLQHSLNVYDCLKIGIEAAGLQGVYSEETIAIVSLMHDLCKVNYYKKGSRNVKDEETGQWYKKEVYEVDEKFPCGEHADTGNDLLSKEWSMILQRLVRRQLQLFVNTKWMIQTSLWLRHFARSESCTTAANTSGDRQIRQ